jgi:hypothetical protein
MERADLADVIRKRCGMDLPGGRPVLTQRDLTNRAAEAGFRLDEGQVSKVVRRLITWQRSPASTVAAWSVALALDPGLVALAMRVSSGQASEWEAAIVRLNVRLWAPEDDLAFQRGHQTLVFPPNPASATQDDVEQARTRTARAVRPQGTSMPGPRGQTLSSPTFLSPSGD